MPFRYVMDAQGKPVMPEVSDGQFFFLFLLHAKWVLGADPVSKGMIDLIKKDSEKGFGDLL